MNETSDKLEHFQAITIHSGSVLGDAAQSADDEKLKKSQNVSVYIKRQRVLYDSTYV